MATSVLWLASLGVVGLPVASAEADKVDGALAQRLARAEASDRLEALVVLDSRGSLPSAEAGTGRVLSALKKTARTSQDPVVAAVEARGDEVVSTFWLKDMVLVRARPATLKALAGLDAVARVIPNFRVEVPPTAEVTGHVEPLAGESTWGIEKIRADRVHALGLTGEGVRVAVLDTGVDISHPDLEGRMATDDPSDPAYPGGWIEFDEAGQPRPTTPHDTQFHGTHTSGTVVGGDASGTQIGVAPGAELMHGVVVPNGLGTAAQVIAGMQWAVAPFDAQGNPAGAPADVVNMSLGASGHYDEFIEPTRNLWRAGIFPAFSIGNKGQGDSGTPGNVYEAVAVGSTDKSDNVDTTSSGETVHNSNWADPPAEWPQSYVVPDVSAPGVEVLSAVPGRRYGYGTGTSMAAPHVAGTAALMFDARADLTVDEALQALTETAFFDDRHGGDRPNPRYGAGRIDAYAAVAEGVLDSGIRGTITDAATGSPMEDVAVTADGIAVRTDSDGRYELRLPAGDYNVKLARFGHATVLLEGVTVEERRFTELSRELTPLRRGQIVGTVTYGPTGFGVPGATVRILGTPIPLSAQSGEDGTYTISDVPEGTYRVVTSNPSAGRSRISDVTVPPDAGVRHDVVLTAPATQLASIASDGTQGNDTSAAMLPSLSGDGRYVAFESAASNLVSGDTNGKFDVFVHDRETGQTERVSVATDGTQANGGSVLADVSADGRYVAFGSEASNLVPGDGNGAADTFVHDRQTGQTTRVSVASDGAEAWRGSGAHRISGDGRFVAFVSDSPSLVPHDTNDTTDVFVHDRETGRTQRVSVAGDGTEGNGPSFDLPSLSGNGRYVSFASSASNLVEGDANHGADIFIHDRETGRTRRVSVASDGTESSGGAFFSAVSADGRHIAFLSSAGDLVGDDTNRVVDAFVHDRVTGQTQRVSVASDGSEGNRESFGFPSLSGDGRFVTFASAATNLAGGDTNDAMDVFVHDRETGRTQWASVAAHGGAADGPSFASELSADGDMIAFNSEASDLVVDDTNGHMDAFVHARDKGSASQPRFAVWDLEVAPSAVLHDEPVTVSARVKNVGDVAGTYQATVSVDGVRESSKMVTVAPNESARVSFTVSRREADDYAVRIGPLTGTFTVRAPVVTVTARDLDGDPLRGAGVALVDGESTLGMGTTDDRGELSFASTRSAAAYTVVVRRERTDADPRSYLLSRHVSVDNDMTIAFTPRPATTARLSLHLDPGADRHRATTYLAPATTAPWAFAQSPGEIVLTPGEYSSRDVHVIDDPRSSWTYPTEKRGQTFASSRTYSRRLGGEVRARVEDVREQAAPDVNVAWSVTDAHRNALATILETGVTPFAEQAANIDTLVAKLRAAATAEHEPELRVFDPSGHDVGADRITWHEQPFAFELDPASVVPAQYELRLGVETGPWSGVREDDASMIVPARAIGTQAVQPGDSFQVRVVFDAPLSGEAAVRLDEDLPAGFTVTGSSAQPNARYRDGVWTWGSYNPGQTITLAYTVRVAAGVVPGSYPFSGAVTDTATGVRRQIAGTQAILAAFNRE